MYLNNYIKSIDFALKNSIYSIKGKNFDGDTFFEKLKIHTQFLKKNNSRIFFFGNGASAAFSNHMALDWSKNGGINSFSLSDSALLTALSNDYNFEDSFLEFLKIYNPTHNDFIVTTSSSGNSKNIINILKYCKKNNIPSLALSGLNKKNMSIMIGEILAKRATEKKISKVYFDRGGYKYHGRIKALADSLRKNGLNF